MIPVKEQVVRLLARTGRELRKAPGVLAGVDELSGVSFPELLELYVRSFAPHRPSFVQVGAHDGRSNDWLHDLTMEHGLHGLLVEPQPRVFEELLRNYRGTDNLVFENVAVSDRDGRRELYVLRDDLEFLKYANQIASFDREHTRSVLARHLEADAPQAVRDEMTRRGLSVDECIDVEIVETCTFETLLDRHGIDHYDVLQVDAEGFDFEIIKLARLDRIRPSLVNYEYEHLSRDDRAACWHYLRTLGYRLFTHESDTTAYSLSAATDRPPSRP